MKGTISAGASAGNGMGPKLPKGQPFGDYRLQWGSRRGVERA